MAGNHHACRLQAKDVLPKFVVTKCKFLTGCDHCHIKFKFDGSIDEIFPVGWLMMHINIVIMQKHQAMTCSTLYSINNTQNLAPKLHTGIFPAMNRKRVLTNIYLNEGVLYHVCGCAMMPCKEGCCSAWNCDLNDGAVFRRVPCGKRIIRTSIGLPAVYIVQLHIGVERHRRKLLLGTYNCSWEEKSDDFAGNTLVLA